ncbi:Protein of uncharacterised function (DUF2971) [Mycobacteroides abscessus subsp. abscessus]|uniref:DUF2971 domain-containing protein n=1 Tax=Mycobacteroides abscessus TaxID=36809 RepID=UPI00092868B4|nr:DUF2971 domain-containing protein [Mycobacteroides abscessus]SHU93320.1 Protein of uncharacterised function (DUF2971) [Mycobacteroides abscessus subsp. abscessus]SHX72986.1 Protein of uncharacterised function (DUF2971) [Mycobacteroides abscessus subsp. abscessus]SIG86956.1 Protein of uncharacterised function (DUF2971) [Mycobacteroides abscessus subsp. abscessus]SKD18822.1 Protein of uncharacterised function (DUF2971) [Mycobacteroides abscessus subsp. abscessus]SKN10264.1 Protein of uncharac
MRILYHYTNAQAFQGVVESAELWATDFRYLNDSRELVYTWIEFVKKLEYLASQPGEYSEAYQAQLKALQLMNAIDLMHFDDAMFIACLTEQSDSVTQWTNYADQGRGFALGFDLEKIAALKVPQYQHLPDGKLTPMIAIVAGGPDDGQSIEFTWGAFRQKVNYGDAVRDSVVEGLLSAVRSCSGTNTGLHFPTKIANCIFQTHALVHRLPLVKHSEFEHEQEHRITITEHFGGKSLSQKQALASLGEPFSVFARGALETVDVQFRADALTTHKPYVRLPFNREALVTVVTGPCSTHRLVEETTRRLLDRNGYRHTEVRASQSSLQ